MLYLLRRIYRNADHYTVLTKQIMKIITNLYGIELERIDVVPHGVDADFFKRDPEPDEVKSIERKYKLDKPNRILFVGHLSRTKRPDVMLRALKIISSRRNDIMLIIASRWGDYYLETIKLIRDLNLGSIVRIISEPIFDNELRALYKSASAFINIHQIYSAYSTALLEAMASGIPPIIYERSGNRYVVDESTGFILRKADPSELADLLAYIVENEEEAKKKGKMPNLKFLSSMTGTGSSSQSTYQFIISCFMIKVSSRIS
jgi:glycosyltransferase involved in cell wall biosynthesis